METHQNLISALCLCVLASVTNANTQTQNDLKLLKKYLFTTNSYNKFIRPVVDQSSTLLISLSFKLVGIESFNDFGQNLTTSGYLTLKWTDQHLAWTSATYGQISSILVPQENVWLPDIAVENGLQSLRILGDSSTQVTISNSGAVTWEPYSVFITKCSVDVTFWPFDSHTCNIKFVVWTYDESEVNLTLTGGNGFQQSNFQENGEWTVDSMSYSSDYSTDKSSIGFTIKFSRRPYFYITNIIVPTVLISLTCSFAFLVPISSKEKTKYAITVFLTYIIFINIIGKSLPENGDKACFLMDFLLVVLLITGLVLIVTLATQRIGFRNPVRKVPKWGYRFVKFVLRQRCVCCRKMDRVTNDGQDVYEGEWTQIIGPWLDCDWKEFADALDFVNFFFFLILILGIDIGALYLAVYKIAIY
ncbi:hypothetical protein CHS0354_041340 [Potamilus streckersoni]|uniref:Uncharacterized protein n=1 Tax=Potamilus streckersoni TaxID=2493646 RepID=A0AAE0SEA6_9BIVA|nr:hypothetical protein CHS0354_041340 [Potamilus streckersoni]